jgi:hypothetical protein
MDWVRLRLQMGSSDRTPFEFIKTAMQSLKEKPRSLNYLRETSWTVYRASPFEAGTLS